MRLESYLVVRELSLFESLLTGGQGKGKKGKGKGVKREDGTERRKIKEMADRKSVV